MTPDEFLLNRGLCNSCRLNHINLPKAWDEFECEGCGQSRNGRFILACSHRICFNCLTPHRAEYKMGCPFAQAITTALFIWQTKCPIETCHSLPCSVSRLSPVKIEIQPHMMSRYLKHRHTLECLPSAMKDLTLQGVDTMTDCLFAPLTSIITDDTTTRAFQTSIKMLLRKTIRSIDKENYFE